MERHIAETLTHMGKKMGFSGFTVNANGILHLALANTGELFIDIQNAGIFLYLLNTFPTLDFKLILAAYTFCEEKAKHNFATNPVLQGDDRLGFAIRIGKEDFSSVSLEGAINQLIDTALRLRHCADH
jgi:type III secretion system chaperone SycN